MRARNLLRIAAIAGLLLQGASLPGVAREQQGPEPANPKILLISVDTLRADRLSSYGYSRPTSPALDALFSKGMRFDQARTVEPLTAPGLASMLTSVYPHEHGSTRNGLRVRPDVVSLPKILRRHGYKTAAFVGNWTLRDQIWGMAGHFDDWEAILTRARWWGFVRKEASGEDISDRAIEWLEGQVEQEFERPFLLWLHYVEPHAPYKLQREFLSGLGVDPKGDIYAASGRYDTEIAYVDHQISRVLEFVEGAWEPDEVMTIFVSDHGESLGEHDYWGHGRHLYEATLHIPMSIGWPGTIEPGVATAPALITDLAPTVLGLLGLQVPDFFRGLDWSPVFAGRQPAPEERVTYYQAHKGATSEKEDTSKVRTRGLLEVARIEASTKEVLRVTSNRRRLSDLAADGEEVMNLSPEGEKISEDLSLWLEQVREGLARSDDMPTVSLSEEDREALKALGYID